jgi:phenylacetate-CoA ligase
VITRLTTLLAITLADRVRARLAAPGPDWEARQFDGLRSVVRHAYRHSQLYRHLWDSAGVHPDSLKDLEDVRRLPVLDRAAWRSAPAGSMPRAAGPAAWYQSGGTTGEPVWTPMTVPDDIMMRAYLLAVPRHHGIRWADSVVQISGRATRQAYFGRVQFVSETEEAAECQRLLHLRRPQLVRGGAWVLWRVAVQALRSGHRLPRAKLVETGGEIMTLAARRTLTAAFSAPVVDHYAASDFGRMACDCREARLHILPDFTCVEILNGVEPAAPGVEGDVVVTNLLSHARPMIRVRIGDRAAWGAGPCPCGNPLPHLAYVAGRQGDVIQTGGRSIAWPAVDSALAPTGEEVLGYQLEQVDAARVRARLSLRSGAAAAQSARDALQSLLRPLELDFELTDDMRMEPGGKTLPIRGWRGYN